MDYLRYARKYSHLAGEAAAKGDKEAEDEYVAVSAALRAAHEADQYNRKQEEQRGEVQEISDSVEDL